MKLSIPQPFRRAGRSLKSAGRSLKSAGRSLKDHDWFGRKAIRDQHREFVASRVASLNTQINRDKAVMARDAARGHEPDERVQRVIDSLRWERENLERSVGRVGKAEHAPNARRDREAE